MATQNVIYFIAGTKPTTEEAVEIALLNDATEAPYSVHVYNQANQSTPIRDADYVAGTVPTEYAAYPVIDPESIPLAPIPEDQAIVSDAGTQSVTNSAGADGHTATYTVVDSEVTALKFASTVAVLDNADTVNVENSAGNLDSTGTVAIASGVVTNVRLASTKTIVSDTQALTGVTPSGSYTNTVTFTVAAGVITAIVLS